MAAVASGAAHTRVGRCGRAVGTTASTRPERRTTQSPTGSTPPDVTTPLTTFANSPPPSSRLYVRYRRPCRRCAPQGCPARNGLSLIVCSLIIGSAFALNSRRSAAQLPLSNQAQRYPLGGAGHAPVV